MADFDEAAANLTNQVEPFLADTIHSINELVLEEESDSKKVGLYILVGSTLVIALVAVVAFVVLKAISAIVELPKVTIGDTIPDDLDLHRFRMEQIAILTDNFHQEFHPKQRSSL